MKRFEETKWYWFIPILSTFVFGLKLSHWVLSPDTVKERFTRSIIIDYLTFINSIIIIGIIVKYLF